MHLQFSCFMNGVSFIVPIIIKSANHFLDEWTLSEIASKLATGEDRAKELLNFWEKQGVLKETSTGVGKYIVLEKAEKNVSNGLYFVRHLS